MSVFCIYVCISTWNSFLTFTVFAPALRRYDDASNVCRLVRIIKFFVSRYIPAISASASTAGIRLTFIYCIISATISDALDAYGSWKKISAFSMKSADFL